jgi:SnoaL-like domain
MIAELPGIIAEHIRAVSAFDLDAIVSTLAPDALVNDNRREILGTQAIRLWVAKEIVADRVTMNIREVKVHHDQFIVRAAYEGNFDRTNLPEVVILTSYLRVQAGEIVSLIIVFNQPSPY